MNSKIEAIIDPTIKEAILDIAKHDEIIKGVIEKDYDEKQFINALLACIICITDRELANLEKLNTLLESNPNIQKLLEEGKDDPTMLRRLVEGKSS